MRYPHSFLFRLTYFAFSYYARIYKVDIPHFYSKHVGGTRPRRERPLGLGFWEGPTPMPDALTGFGLGIFLFYFFPFPPSDGGKFYTREATGCPQPWRMSGAKNKLV